MIKSGVIQDNKTPCVVTGRPCCGNNCSTKQADDCEPIAADVDATKVASMKKLGDLLNDDDTEQ